MGLGWLTVLQKVPWSTVISNAPAVADGAKKLWNAVGKRVSAESKPPEPVVVNPGDIGSAVSQLAQKVADMETANAETRAQLLASSTLLKTLAEQNETLVQRIEANRRRLLGLALLWALSVAAGVALFVIYGRPIG